MLTDKELEERTRRVAQQKAEKQEQRQAEKEQKRTDSQILRQGKWHIRYDVCFLGISTASHWNQETGEFIAHFAIQSLKDNFSRPAARRALVQHIIDDTHKITFNFIPVRREGADESLMRRLKRLNKDHLVGLIEQQLYERSFLLPNEFPSWIRNTEFGPLSSV